MTIRAKTLLLIAATLIAVLLLVYVIRLRSVRSEQLQAARQAIATIGTITPERRQSYQQQVDQLFTPEGLRQSDFAAERTAELAPPDNYRAAVHNIRARGRSTKLRRGVVLVAADQTILDEALGPSRITLAFELTLVTSADRWLISNLEDRSSAPLPLPALNEADRAAARTAAETITVDWDKLSQTSQPTLLEPYQAQLSVKFTETLTQLIAFNKDQYRKVGATDPSSRPDPTSRSRITKESAAKITVEVTAQRQTYLVDVVREDGWKVDGVDITSELTP